MLNKIIPILGVFAIAPFINAQDTPTPAKEAAAETKPAEKAPELTPEKKQLFLQALGWLVAQQSGVGTLEFPADEADEIAKGFAMSLKGEGKDFAAKITPLEAEYAAFIQEKQRIAQQKAAERTAKIAADNKKLGTAYIENCKKDKAYQVLKSGVLMKVEKAGDDKIKATPKSFLSVRYTGKLIDGTIFDSSERNDKDAPVQFTEESAPVPFPYPLSNLIPGWVEALQLVGKGAKVTLVIPSDQGYGDNGAPGGAIQPGATLVFDLEVIDISDKSLAPEAPSFGMEE